MNAVRNIKPVLVRSARVMHLSRRQTLTQWCCRLPCPASSPGYASAFR